MAGGAAGETADSITVGMNDIVRVMPWFCIEVRTFDGTNARYVMGVPVVEGEEMHDYGGRCHRNNALRSALRRVYNAPGRVPNSCAVVVVTLPLRFIYVSHVYTLLAWDNLRYLPPWKGYNK